MSTTNIALLQEQNKPRKITIKAEDSGDWIPAEELRKKALAALPEGLDIALDLHAIDHLDASALQILLSLDGELQKNGRSLELVNASPELRQWFEYAGIAQPFFPEKEKDTRPCSKP